MAHNSCERLASGALHLQYTALQVQPLNPLTACTHTHGRTPTTPPAKQLTAQLIPPLHAQ